MLLGSKNKPVARQKAVVPSCYRRTCPPAVTRTLREESYERVKRRTRRSWSERSSATGAMARLAEEWPNIPRHHRYEQHRMSSYPLDYRSR